MNPGQSSFPGGMSDDDVDRILAAASKNLLAYIEATTDPTPTLTAIMARITPAVPASSEAVTATDHDPYQTTAALVIGVRCNVLSLARDLGDAAVLVRDLVRSLFRDLVRDVPRARVRDLVRALDRDRDTAYAHARDIALACALDISYALDLDRALARALDLARTLDRAHARARALDGAFDLDRDLLLARAFDLDRALDLVRALDLTLDLARELGTQQMDASGADLSDIAIEDLNALDGVVWTGQTTWPPGIADQVRAFSREIRPGVYQVSRGDNPDRVASAPM